MTHDQVLMCQCHPLLGLCLETVSKASLCLSKRLSHLWKALTFMFSGSPLTFITIRSCLTPPIYYDLTGTTALDSLSFRRLQLLDIFSKDFWISASFLFLNGLESISSESLLTFCLVFAFNLLLGIGLQFSLSESSSVFDLSFPLFGFTLTTMLSFWSDFGCFDFAWFRVCLTGYCFTSFARFGACSTLVRGATLSSTFDEESNYSYLSLAEMSLKFSTLL